MKIQQISPEIKETSAGSAPKKSLTVRQQVALWSFNLLLILLILRAQAVIEEAKMPERMRVIRVGNPARVNVSRGAVTKPTLRPHATISWDTPVSCDLLAQGAWDEVRRARHQANIRPRRTYEDFMTMTSNCSRLIHGNDYEMTVLSEEEAEFPIAFAIRMHKNIFQVEQLLRAIYRPQNVYCIHIDRKSPLFVHKAIQSLVRCLPNVFIASQLQYYVYESSSPVWADLQCMQDLLNSSVKWKYFLNLPGQEFPLKTNLEIVRILKFLNGTNDIETYPYPQEYLHRISNKHFIANDEVFLSSDAKVPFKHSHVAFRKGNAYNSFSREFVEWLMVNEIARDLYEWANDTASPDELVWATLNTLPGAPGGYNTSLWQPYQQFVSRFIDWGWTAAQCLLHHYVHNICIFSSADLFTLLHRNEMFANKFDMSYDPVVLDCLEEIIKQRRRNPDPDKNIDWDWMKSLPHVKHKFS